MKDLLLTEYYSEETVKCIKFQLTSNKNLGLNNFYRLDLGSTTGDTIMYEVINLLSYKVYFSFSESKINFSIGCLGNVSLEDVIKGIEELEGKEMKTIKECIFSKAAPLTASSKVVFLEESGNFLISSSLKAFTKEDFEVRSTTVSSSIFRSISGNTANYKGYSIDIAGSNKKAFLEKLYFIKSLMSYVNNNYSTNII